MRRELLEAPFPEHPVEPPGRVERVVMGLLWSAMFGVGAWMFCTYLSGGAG